NTLTGTAGVPTESARVKALPVTVLVIGIRTISAILTPLGRRTAGNNRAGTVSETRSGVKNIGHPNRTVSAAAGSDLPRQLPRQQPAGDRRDRRARQQQ